MFFKGWDLYDLLVGFFDTVITKWFGKENPFADFNDKMTDVEAFSKGLAGIFYNGKA